jgi:hypothetical protein
MRSRFFGLLARAKRVNGEFSRRIQIDSPILIHTKHIFALSFYEDDSDKQNANGFFEYRSGLESDEIVDLETRRLFVT